MMPLNDILNNPTNTLLVIDSKSLREGLKSFAQEIINETRQSIEQEQSKRKPFYTRNEVARMFSKAERTIDYWIRHGLISRVKIGNSVLIPREQIEIIEGMERRKANYSFIK